MSPNIKAHKVDHHKIVAKVHLLIEEDEVKIYNRVLEEKEIEKSKGISDAL